MQALDSAQSDAILQTDLNMCTNSNRKDFSFNRTDTHSSARATLKLQEIRHQLEQLDVERLSELLIQQIQHNEQLRAELLKIENKYDSSREQVRLLSQSLAFKKESFLMLSENQIKNEQQIGRLEAQLKLFRGKYNLQSWATKVDSDWHRKYNQLARHMDIYVENNREVQQEFARQREITQKEMNNIYEVNLELNMKIKELAITNTVQSQQMKCFKLELMQSNKLLEKIKISKEQQHSTQNKISWLQHRLNEANETQTSLKAKCNQLKSHLQCAHLLNQQLRLELSKAEIVVNKQKEGIDTIINQHVLQLQADRERMEQEINTLKLEQLSKQSSQEQLTQLKDQNQHLRNQLDQTYKTIANLKGEMILVKGEADRARSQLKRQTDKNNEIRIELDNFCKKRRDTASPNEALSQIESSILNQSSFNRKQCFSSHKKIQDFKLDEIISRFSPGKQNIRESCIIGEQTANS